MSLDYQTFFCLAAKVRQAQKEYFKAKQAKAENARELLIYSIRLENVLDACIKKILPTFDVSQLKNTWQIFIARDMKEIELDFAKKEFNS